MASDEKFWIRVRCARFAVIFLEKLARMEEDPRVVAAVEEEDLRRQAEYCWRRKSKHHVKWSKSKRTSDLTKNKGNYPLTSCTPSAILLSMENKRVVRYYAVSSGPYKHSLWSVKAVLADETGYEYDGGLVREFDTKKEAKAAAKLMNEGIQ